MLMNEMVIFYTVVQQNSFSGAASTLGVSKSFISKHITELEKKLKTRLLNRTTRQLSLTEAGEIFYQHCKSLAAVADDGFDAIMNLNNQPSGKLKISVPPALAVHLFSEPMITYMQLYPDVTLNVNLESKFVDIIKDGFDLVIRVAIMPDSSLISQKIASLGSVVCASPQYMEKNGPIHTPEELSSHVFTTYSGHRFSKTLTFTRKNKQHTVEVPSIFDCNSLDLMVKILGTHACMAVLPTLMAKQLEKENKVIICLPEYQLPEVDLYAVYPARAFMPLKVKAFIDILKLHLMKISE
jgi:DNA-binding transcriptional LysR family regulator